MLFDPPYFCKYQRELLDSRLQDVVIFVSLETDILMGTFVVKSLSASSQEKKNLKAPSYKNIKY